MQVSHNAILPGSVICFLPFKKKLSSVTVIYEDFPDEELRAD